MMAENSVAMSVMMTAQGMAATMVGYSVSR